MEDLKNFYDISYKQFFSTVDEVKVNSSLLDFNRTVISKYFNGKNNLNILEAGTGAKSVYEEEVGFNGLTIAVDYSKNAIDYALINQDKENVEYVHGDILKVNLPYKFDLVLDSHLLHCMTSFEDREKYLQRVYNWLKPGGVFALECMVSHREMNFDDQFLFLEDDCTLLQQVGKSALPVRYIPDSLSLEELLKSYELKIEYFIVFSNLKVIPDCHRSYPLQTDPDLARIVCRKI